MAEFVGGPPTLQHTLKSLPDGCRWSYSEDVHHLCCTRYIVLLWAVNAGYQQCKSTFTLITSPS